MLGREWRHLKPTAGDDILRLRQGPWRILLAVDDSGPSARAAETAAVMTEPCCGEVLVFRAREVEGSGRTPSLETPASPEELVGHVVEMLRGEGLRVRGEAFTTTRGETARDIVEDARHREADLIIMGSRSLSDVVALLRGASVAHEAICRTDCPVLVVR